MFLKSSLAQRLSTRKTQYRLRQEIQRASKSGNPIKVVVGSAGIEVPGWFITDVPVLNALNYMNWRIIFKPRTVNRILLEHVVEHWYEKEFRKFLWIARKFLDPDGLIRIAVPDGFHPDHSYIEAVKPGGIGAAAEDHKCLYDFQSMGAILSGAGYDYDLLEYFDRSGVFHSQAWDISDGFIRRSAEHDERNSGCPLTYTSLIIDTWPHK